ncbi:Sec63-domain-containing protein, partial [Aureobasidium melanogenum]
HITASATDSILEYLKDQDLKDFDKKREIDDIIGVSLSSKEYNELVNLGKKITDYDAQDEDENMGDADDAAEGDDIDDRQGVAVDFGDEDEEEGQSYEVRDGEGDSDDEDVIEDPDNVVGAGTEDAEDMAAEGDEEDLVFSAPTVSRSAKADQEDIIPAHEIDAFWLQRQIGQLYEDAHIQQDKTSQALDMMSGLNEDGEEKQLRDVENDLMELFDYEHPELVSKLVKNRDKVVWVTRWRRAGEDEPARVAVEREMVQAGHGSILKELKTRQQGTDGQAQGKMQFDLMDLDTATGKSAAPEEKKEGLVGGLQPSRNINLENLVFDQGNHLMTNPSVKLPQGSTKRTFKGYDEIHVPAPKRKREDFETPNLPTTELPEWARIGFGSSKELNRIQTRCFPTAFKDDGNMLICAPTGSGKTNVAMLAMLREIGKHRNPETGEIDLDAFKIIFIAPLKALVQEQVGNFGARLAPYGIKVSELTGDRQLTKQQIAETQVIVTTPEKWDVITRKATDTSYTNLVRLICIDEIHLL